ncbi:hypothetical protein BN946_scf184868.g39 [Trametes cinnabarina]|uniref:DUF6697 domain-containing protein n=1 Tax=Pycnoporus cinnabarinus TaxID=5643 RepID=A0A060SQG8_PYCCI|nr:hypothetical protein BN946_scf184868.g39 [Trametes cinnabarina]
MARIAELEASMLALQQRCDHLQTTAKDAAYLEAQIRISKLEDELAYVSSQHMMCSSTVQRCDAELASLMQEHKSLVQAHEGQRRAAAESSQQVAALRAEKEELERERDRLGAELTQQHNAHESFVFCQDKKHEKATAEITRLQDIIRARETAVNTLAEEKMQLKAALDASQTELLQAQNQLAATIVQCDTWKVELEDVLARQGIDAEQMLQNAAKERENADELLHNAANKIEVLELQLRQKDIEITKLREEVARKAQEQRITDVSQRPPTALVPSSSTAVKRAVEEERATVSVSASQPVAWALNLAAHGSPMPLGRVKELSTLPTIAVDLGLGQVEPAIFTRQSLSSVLGGSIQGLIVRATELARKHGISTYLCPNMDHNAWSPPGPGRHGYMQVGLGRDRDLFNNGEYRHVFVGAGKHFVYCGWYHVLRVERLTQDEWTTLPPKVRTNVCSGLLSVLHADADSPNSLATQVQTTYSQTTVNKEKSNDFKSAQHVLAMYNAGELRAPCVRLQCVGFDTAFYQELVRANDRYFEHEPRPMPPANAAGGSTKRRRVSKPKKVGEDFEEEVSLAVAVASIKSATPNGATGPEPTLTAGAPLASVSAASQTVVARPDVTVDVPTASHLSASAGPSTQASADPPRRSTRLLGRRQAISSATFTLRIPSGKIKDRTSQSMGRGESDIYLSSGLDDDDMYADM